jgi:hypothetical protein
MKIAIASQARHVNVYRSLKSKILKGYANIYVNKQCLVHNLTPKYINITIPHTSPAAIHTQRKITKLPLKDEIKFLYLKKTTLNKQLYQTHLTLKAL